MTTTVFLGTPEASLPTLRLLSASHDVKAVITMPDRPRGRSGTPAPPPVKTEAEKLGLDVLQPDSRSVLDAALDDLRPYDVGVVVAYGRILSSDALATPVRGLLNVHFSLLPRWRGAAPVARSIIAGDEMSGVTIIELDVGMDTGPVLTAQAIDIRDDENAGDLESRLAVVGARLLVASLSGYADGTLTPVPQVEEGATYARMLGPSDRVLSAEMTVVEFVNHVRGLAPKPGGHLELDGVHTLVLRADPASGSVRPGVWETVDGWPVIGLADGAVRLGLVQPQGKRPMTGDAWARGRQSESGTLGA